MNKDTKKRPRRSNPATSGGAAATPQTPDLQAFQREKGPMITEQGIVRCRFDLFVRLKSGQISYYKDQQRCWCYRGDTFTDQEDKMLRNLLKVIKNHGQKFFLMELYDNQMTKDNGQRLVLKIHAGLIRVNRLNQFAHWLRNFPIAEILNPYKNETED